MNQKLAICLQVSPKDVWLGVRLVKLICSIEPEKREDIQFMVAARRDTNPPAVNEIHAVAKTRFARANVIRGKRFGVGWPAGPNDLWQETMMRVAQGYDAGHIQADGVLTFEPDCLPLRPDWLDCLADEWREIRARGKFVCGHAHGWPEGEELGAPTHINGNAIFHAKTTDYFPQLNGCDSRQGWDAFHGKLLLQIGADTKMIHQRYRIPQITREELEAIRKGGEIPALFHGIKGETGLEAVKAMVADGSFFSRLQSLTLA